MRFNKFLTGIIINIFCLFVCTIGSGKIIFCLLCRLLSIL